MQIEIYNMIPVEDKLSITLEAICDSFSSLLWDIEYYSCGAFEVYIAASPQNIEIFQTGRIVGRDDDMEHYGLIESVEIQTDAEDGDYLIVRGRFLICLLERRIIYPTVNFTKETAYADIIKTVVQFNAVVSGVRKIPGLSVGTAIGSCWEQKTKLQISYDNLMRWIYTICEKIGGTANIRLNKITGEQYEMILELSEGADRSIMQEENPHIVFSDGYICFHFRMLLIYLSKRTLHIFSAKVKEKKENVLHIVMAMNLHILTAMKCMLMQKICQMKNRLTEKQSLYRRQSILKC